MKWAIDVSGYDGRRAAPGGGYYLYDRPMDWVRARDVGGLSLAIIKSSEGMHGIDGAFRMNWSAARGVLPRMAYHFCRSNQNAIAQAKHVIELLEPDFNQDSDYVILDFETMDGMTGQQCLEAAGSWLYELEKFTTKHLPLIYTYPAFWRKLGGEKVTWAKKYPLGLAQWPLDNWIASFPVTKVFTLKTLQDLKDRIESGDLRPVTLKPWDEPALWQFTSRVDSLAIPGHPGIKKVVDYNAVYMPLPELGTQPNPEPRRCPACGQVLPGQG